MKLVPKFVVSLCLALALGFVSPPPILAQAVYGNIRGVVKDASGAVVPGVTVTITSIDRKTVDTAVTNENGQYLKERMLPGAYEVKAELQGFKTQVVPRVDVSVDTTVPIDFTLQPGELAETVNVTGGSPLLKVDRADVSTRFSTQEITELPVLDRNFTKFVLLTPGTQQLGWQHAASENPQGSTQIQINGQHFSGTQYQLDGTENRDAILGIIVINPTLESIQETKITSQNYDAEFGQATAGVVSVQTKSGTNTIHGSAFEFNRTDNLQARNPFTQFQKDPLTGRYVPETKRNQFGGSVGGPIQQDKWFFFGDYQGTRSTEGGSRLYSVPTAEARNGNFSAYGVSIFDPASNADPKLRTQFANNVIPQDRLSAQAKALLQSIPLPNTAGRDNGTRDNYVASGSETFDENSFNIRVDGRLAPGLNTFGRYSFGNFFRDGPTAFGSGGGENLVSLGGQSKARNQSIAYGLDKVFTKNWVADFRFGFFRYHVNVLPFDYGTNPAQDAGIPGLNNPSDPFTSGLPGFFLEGDRGFNFGSGLGVNRCNCPLDEDEKQFQMVTNWTRYLGNHSMKFGVDVRRAYNLRVPSDRHRSGELTFRPALTSGPGGGGLSLASFMLGDVTRFTRYVSSSTDARERQWRHFYYAQDTWRATEKLTLNYGLRLDIINPQTLNAAGNAGFLDLSTGEIAVVGVGGVGLNGDVQNSFNWAPRLGATYQLDDRTVIRGGYGRSYDIGVFGSLFGHTVTQNLPVLLAQENNPPNDFASVFNLKNGPPAPQFPTVPDTGRFPLANGVFARALPTKQRPPAVDAFNITIQRQLSPVLAAEVGYVANRGRRVFAGDGPDVNPNQPVLDGFPSVPIDMRKPFYAGAVTTRTFQSLGGAFGWTQGLAYYCNCAHNWYDSLQTKLTKRFSNGYSVQANYTWQRAVQETGDYFFWDRNLNKGPADWDRTHNFTLALVADLPFGRGKKWASDVSSVMDAIVGGWQFNTNTFIASGLPFSVSYRNAFQDRDTGPNRPDLIGDPKGPQTKDEWFNAAPIGDPTSAFGRPAVATFGNLKRNELRGPGYWRADASLFKHFRFNDKDLEVRIEAVNILNHVNLGQPDSEVGVPGTPNTNAGRITSTAANDQMRNFQFGVRFTF